MKAEEDRTLTDRLDKINFKIKHNETSIKKNLAEIKENSELLGKNIDKVKAEAKKGIADVMKKQKTAGGRKSSNAGGGEGGGGGGPEGLTDHSKSRLSEDVVEKPPVP